MNNSKFEALKIERQICFPLYACSREVIKRYKPYLDEIDLTYTQYITMMVLWEEGAVTVKELGERLTPLLKKMEGKGLITRKRSREDERNLIVSVTPAGEKLKERAAEIPARMARCLKLDPEEAAQLYRLLYKMLDRTDS